MELQLVLSFKEYLLEQADEKHRGTLHSFDVDETLFKTNAKVHVKHGDKHVTSLSNAEYNTHKLKKGHHYDYSEFEDSKKFHDESHPISKMLDKVKAIHKNIEHKPHHKIIINTARSDMNDKNTYLDKFKKHGLPIHDMHVHRAGNDTTGGSVAEKKARVIKKHLEQHPYKKVHVYDDSKENLKHSLALQKEHPNTKIHAWHVQHDGSIKKYHGGD